MAEIKAKKVIFKNRDGEYLLPMTEDKTGLVLFDTILKDHVLTYEESKGLALQGTYVYKNAIAGSRYGYPDFYNKCLEEYQNSSNTKQWLKSNITKVGSVVDNQGVLSGFSTANYVTLPKILEVNKDTESWECQIKLSFSEIPELATILELGLTSGTLYNLIVGQRTYADNTTSTCFGFYSHSTSFGNMPSYGKLDVLPNTTYFIRYGFDKSSRVMYIDYSLTGEAGTYIRDCAYGIATMLGQPPSAPIIGKDLLNTMTVDLNYSYIKIDGKIWWSGTDNLTTNPNGHFYYDISQKELIDNMFESTGMAWMYGVDTENERIFLPRNVWFEQMSMDDVGKAVEAGVPNITGYIINDSGAYTGAFYNAGSVSSDINGAGEGKTDHKIGFNASRCSAVYGKSDTVQPNAVKKLLYICVGNTVSKSTITDVVDVTTTENDTIPFGYSTYQSNAQPSISWLKSEGQWNDGNAYITFYNWAVNKLGEAFANGHIKQVTETFDDYDLVINQDDITFRLPLLDGSESLPSDKYDDLTLGTSGAEYIAPANGWFVARANGATSQGASARFVSVTTNNTNGCGSYGANPQTFNLFVKKNEEVQLFYATHSNVEYVRFVYAQGNGSLYFKVANAVQNLQIIDTADLIENYPTKSMVDGQWVQKYLEIFRGVKALGSYSYDLSNYLPNDGYDYEVMLDGYVNSNSTSLLTVGTKASPRTNKASCINANLQSLVEGRGSSNSFILPINTERKVYTEITGEAITTTNFLCAIAYRRIGTNV